MSAMKPSMSIYLYISHVLACVIQRRLTTSTGRRSFAGTQARESGPPRTRDKSHTPPIARSPTASHFPTSQDSKLQVLRQAWLSTCLLRLVRLRGRGTAVLPAPHVPCFALGHDRCIAVPAQYRRYRPANAGALGPRTPHWAPPRQIRARAVRRMLIGLVIGRSLRHTNEACSAGILTTGRGAPQ